MPCLPFAVEFSKIPRLHWKKGHTRLGWREEFRFK